MGAGLHGMLRFVINVQIDGETFRCESEDELAAVMKVVDVVARRGQVERTASALGCGLGATPDGVCACPMCQTGNLS